MMLFNSQKFLTFLILPVAALMMPFAPNLAWGESDDENNGDYLPNRYLQHLWDTQYEGEECLDVITETIGEYSKTNPSIEDIKNLEQEIVRRRAFDLTTTLSPSRSVSPQIIYYKSAPIHLRLLKMGLPLVKTPKDFLTLAQKTMNPASNAYQQGIDLFVYESMAVFFETNPSVDDILQLRNQVSAELVLNRTMPFFMIVQKKTRPIHTELIKRGLPFVKSVEDYFKLIELKVSSFSKRFEQAYEKVILKSLDTFSLRHPSFDDILRLERTCRFSSLTQHAFAIRGIMLTRTVDEYFTFLERAASPPDKAEIISKSSEHFLSMNPLLSDIGLIRQSVSNAEIDMAMRERGYLIAGDETDHYLALAHIHSTAIKSYDHNPKLKQRSDDLVRRNLDKFFALRPSPSDIAILSHAVFHSETRLEIFERGLSVIKTATQFAALVYEFRRTGENQEQRQTLETFVSTNFDRIFSLAGTAEEAATLRREFRFSPLGVQFAKRGLALARSANDFLLLTHLQTLTFFPEIISPEIISPEIISETDKLIAQNLDRFFEMNPSDEQVLELALHPPLPDTFRRLVELALLQAQSGYIFSRLIDEASSGSSLLGEKKARLDLIFKNIGPFFSKAPAIEEINTFIHRANQLLTLSDHIDTYEAHEAIVERALRYIDTPEEFEKINLPPEGKRSQRFLNILRDFEQTKLPYLVFQEIAVTHPKSPHEMTVFEKGRRVVLSGAVLKELHYDRWTHKIRGVMVVERSKETNPLATVSVAYEVFWNMNEKIYKGLRPAIDPKTQQPIDAEKYLEEWRKRKAKEEEIREAAALQTAVQEPSLAKRITDSLFNSWESLVDSVSGLFLSAETEKPPPPPRNPLNSLENSLSESNPGTEKIRTAETRPQAVPSVEQSLFESYAVKEEQAEPPLAEPPLAEPTARPRRAPIDFDEERKEAEDPLNLEPKQEQKRRAEYEIKTQEIELPELKLSEQEVVEKILKKLEPLYGRGKVCVHIIGGEETDPNKNSFLMDHPEAEGFTRLVECGERAEFEINLFFRNRGTKENPLVYAEAVDEEIRHGLQLGKNPGRRLDLADEEREKIENTVKKSRSVHPLERASEEQLARLVFDERAILFIAYGVNLDLVQEVSRNNFSHLERELSREDQEKLQKQAKIYLLALQNAHDRYEQSLSFLERNLRKADRFSLDAAKGIPRFMLEMAIADAAWYLLQGDIDGLFQALSHLTDSEFFTNYLTFHTFASSGTEGMARIQSFVQKGKIPDYRQNILSRASGVALAEFVTTYFGRLISHPLWREYEKNPSLALSCQIAKEVFFDPYNFSEAGVRATSFVTASYLVDMMAKTIMISQRAPLPPPARIALGSLTFLIHKFFTSLILPEIDMRRVESHLLEKREEFLALINKEISVGELSEAFSQLHLAFDEYRIFLHREVIETMEEYQSKFLDLERKYGERVATLNLLSIIDEFGEEETYGHPIPTSRNNFTSELKAPRFRIRDQWYGADNLGTQIITAEITKPLYDGTPHYEGLPSDMVGPYSPTVLRMKFALQGIDRNEDGQLSSEEKKLIPQKMREDLNLYEREKAALEKEYEEVLLEFANNGLFESGRDKFLKRMEEDLERNAFGPGAGRPLNQETMLVYKNGRTMLLPRMNLEEDFKTRRVKVLEQESQAHFSRNRLSTYGQEIALIHHALQTIQTDPQGKSLLEGYLKLIANQWYLDEMGAAEVRGELLTKDLFDEILYSTTSSL
ncbi:MAG: hypothetical protein AAB309_03280 [Deltaproteobacteria bacterium]